MTTKGQYVRCKPTDIPEGVRFDVPRREQGQIVERAYGGFGAAEHGPGDPYMRILDTSESPAEPEYYRWAE